MTPANLLIIMAAEHARGVLGAAGHPMVRTPNLDRLALEGARFTDAYCNCPICVPSRASFATGRYVHDIRRWDNATPYDGTIPSWGHRLRDAGHHAASIGKLHYRSGEDDNGFAEEMLPMYVPNGIGDPLSLIRDDPPARKETLKLGLEAGRGTPPTRATTTASWTRLTTGCATARRAMPTNPGCCLSPWFARIFL